MSEQKSKAELIAMRRAVYTHFDALIAGFSEQQLQAPVGDDGWSIKDHIVHLMFWEHVNLLETLKTIAQGTSWIDPGYESSEEVVEQTNQRVYLQNKDRSLADVLSEFQETHRQVIAYLEKLSEEQLKTPYEWLGGGTIATWLTEPNGHYQEHEEYIRNLQKHLG